MFLDSLEETYKHLHDILQNAYEEGLERERELVERSHSVIYEPLYEDTLGQTEFSVGGFYGATHAAREKLLCGRIRMFFTHSTSIWRELGTHGSSFRLVALKQL